MVDRIEPSDAGAPDFLKELPHGAFPGTYEIWSVFHILFEVPLSKREEIEFLKANFFSLFANIKIKRIFIKNENGMLNVYVLLDIRQVEGIFLHLQSGEVKPR